MPIALAAVAALALMLWPSRPARPPATAPDTTVVTTNAHRPTGAAAAGVSGTAPLTTLVAPVGTLLRQDPLQTEADHVYADARSAVQFLALNFLPTPPDTVTGRESRGTSGS
ncbi:MAG TPA: hypothetical protein VHE61_22730 [Opitutaceae bacterium]|nr:hypothetical protein [Opitutaceae bacterium]